MFYPRSNHHIHRGSGRPRPCLRRIFRWYFDFVFILLPPIAHSDDDMGYSGLWWVPPLCAMRGGEPGCPSPPPELLSEA